MICPVCSSKSVFEFRRVDKYAYFSCKNCDLIFLDPEILTDTDRGITIKQYDETYWHQELHAAKDRAYGACLARLAESLYYLRIPLQVFLDVGTGPGYLLDAVSHYLPDLAPKTFGIEKFPPEESQRTKNANYFVGDLHSFPHKADCGLCMEVIEHLTPTMLLDLLKQLASVSNKGALYIINSGQPDFVRNEDYGYLDPLVRGHIVSWSVEAVRLLAEGLGFSVHRLPGKTWAMALEYRAQTDSYAQENIQNRIWNPIKKNIDLLADYRGGSVFKILGLESARAYR
jgi:hypothetical protein